MLLPQVVLTWRYGGLSAYVAGDVVGSWSSRVPLLRCKVGRVGKGGDASCARSTVLVLGE